MPTEYARRSIDITAGLGRRLRHGAARRARSSSQDRDYRIRYELCRQTVNPHDPTRTPGVRRAALRRRSPILAPLALGTQTGGSAIRPASLRSGGHKPSHRHGVKPLRISIPSAPGAQRCRCCLARVRDDRPTSGETAAGRSATDRGGEPRRGTGAPKPLQHWSAIRTFEEHGARVEDGAPLHLCARMRHITTSSILKWRARWRSRRANIRINSARAEGETGARYPMPEGDDGSRWRATPPGAPQIFDRYDACWRPARLERRQRTDKHRQRCLQPIDLVGVPANHPRRGPNGHQWAFRSSAAWEGHRGAGRERVGDACT